MSIHVRLYGCNGGFYESENSETACFTNSMGRIIYVIQKSKEFVQRAVA